MTLRRRFLTILAGAGATALLGGAAPSAGLTRWRGVALGARATIVLDHPEGTHLIRRARAEIARLEAIFSLHRRDSALSRLNAEGHLDAPPADLLSCLTLARRIHRATGGAFDPTVQPLWDLHARHAAAGTRPSSAEIAAGCDLVGFDDIEIDPSRLDLGRSARALTLNGIAQGFITDRIAALLRLEGVEDSLIEAGEIAALGRRPDGTPWRLGIADVTGATVQRLHLSDQALATSAPMGTILDPAGKVGHILDPRTGRPSATWSTVSVTAPLATVADALSTAFSLMRRDELDRALAAIPEARIAYLD